MTIGIPRLNRVQCVTVWRVTAYGAKLVRLGLTLRGSSDTGHVSFLLTFYQSFMKNYTHADLTRSRIEGQAHGVNELIRSYTKNTFKENKFGGKKHNKQEWDFVPSPPFYIRYGLDILKHERIKSNITDLGCGISPFLLYISHFYWATKLVGIDNEQKYLDALSLFDDKIHVHKGNLNRLDTISKVLIRQSKAVYIYMPLRNPDKFTKLMLKIWGHMSPDSVLISFYATERMSNIKTFRDNRKTVPGTNIEYWKKPKD